MRQNYTKFFKGYIFGKQAKNTDLENNAIVTSTIFIEPHDYISKSVCNRWSRAVSNCIFCPMFSLIVMLAYKWRKEQKLIYFSYSTDRWEGVIVSGTCLQTSSWKKNSSLIHWSLWMACVCSLTSDITTATWEGCVWVLMFKQDSCPNACLS